MRSLRVQPVPDELSVSELTNGTSQRDAFAASLFVCTITDTYLSRRSGSLRGYRFGADQRTPTSLVRAILQANGEPLSKSGCGQGTGRPSSRHG